SSESVMAAVVGLFSFVLVNAYFILFEWLMNGQTPGKRLIGVRAIKEGGYALTFLDTLVRNLMRVVDFLPLFYGVGLASMLATQRSQRLGDLLSGTVLVHQRQVGAEKHLPELPVSAADAAPIAPERLAALPPEVFNATLQYFEILDELAPRYRQEIAAELVELVRQSSGLIPEPTQSAEAFLASI